MQLDDEENADQSVTLNNVASSSGQNQESGSVMELTEVDYNVTQDVGAKEEKREETAEPEELRQSDNKTPQLSSTQHQLSGTMMELTTAVVDETQNQTRDVLAAIGALPSSALSQQVNMSVVSADMTIAEQSYSSSAAPTPVAPLIAVVANESKSAIGRDVTANVTTNSSMDISAHVSTSRILSKDNV